MAATAALAIVAVIVHIFSAVIWVGGMFFAHQVLRPAAAMLEPGPRLDLWSRVLGRFFAWVFTAIVLLLASGYTLIFDVYGGFRTIALHIQLMQGLGILMMVLFLHLYFAPWRRFRAAAARQDWVEGGRQLIKSGSSSPSTCCLVSSSSRSAVAAGIGVEFHRAAARVGNENGSIRRSVAFIVVLPSGEIHVALSPPS
jgi:uncharacterized membrane protein